MPKEVRVDFELETEIMYRLQAFGGHTREQLELALRPIDIAWIEAALLRLRSELLIICTDGVWWFRAPVVS